MCRLVALLPKDLCVHPQGEQEEQDLGSHQERWNGGLL